MTPEAGEEVAEEKTQVGEEGDSLHFASGGLPSVPGAALPTERRQRVLTADSSAVWGCSPIPAPGPSAEARPRALVLGGGWLVLPRVHSARTLATEALGGLRRPFRNPPLCTLVLITGLLP